MQLRITNRQAIDGWRKNRGKDVSKLNWVLIEDVMGQHWHHQECKQLIMPISTTRHFCQPCLSPRQWALTCPCIEARIREKHFRDQEMKLKLLLQKMVRYLGRSKLKVKRHCANKIQLQVPRSMWPSNQAKRGPDSAISPHSVIWHKKMKDRQSEPFAPRHGHREVLDCVLKISENWKLITAISLITRSTLIP